MIQWLLCIVLTDLCSLSALRQSIKMHRNSVHKNVNHDWWSLFVEEAKGWKLYDSNDSFLDRIANILCFAVSPCPALSLLILTLTIMLCHKTTANVSNALILKNCLESSASLEPGLLRWTRDAVIVLRVISSRGCSGALLSLPNTIILTTCSDRARRRAQNTYTYL